MDSNEVIPADVARARLREPIKAPELAPEQAEIAASIARLNKQIDALSHQHNERRERMLWHADAGVPAGRTIELFGSLGVSEWPVVSATPEEVRLRVRGTAPARDRDYLVFRPQDGVWSGVVSGELRILENAADILAGTTPVIQPEPYMSGYPRKPDEIVPAEEARAILARPEPPELPALRAEVQRLEAIRERPPLSAEAVKDRLRWHADAGLPVVRVVEHSQDGGNVVSSAADYVVDRMERGKVAVRLRGLTWKEVLQIQGTMAIRMSQGDDGEAQTAYVIPDVSALLNGTAPRAAAVPYPANGKRDRLEVTP